MTTKADIFNQAKAICERFSPNVLAPLYMKVDQDCSDELKIYFGNVVNPDHWDSYCTVSVTFNPCGAREQSDDIGFYSEQNVNIHFRLNGMSYNTFEQIQPKLLAVNQAVELMGLLVTELPSVYTERLATHAERAEQNKVAIATRHCKGIVTSNCKNMRVDGAKVLSATPSDLRRGEYEISYNDKKFKVILTDDNTMLVRTY